MRGVNKAIILGTLGRDPELTTTTNGNSCCKLSLATNEKWTDKQTGNQVEHTEWHRVIIWGRPAEMAAQYLSKGSQVYIEGKIKTRKWQDDAGLERYITEIVVSGYDGVMQFVGGNRQGAATTPQNGQTGYRPATATPQPAEPQQQAAMAAQQPLAFDDDIPF